MAKTSTTATAARDHERDYSALLGAVSTQFAHATVMERALFKVDLPPGDLFATYLEHLGAEQQVHNCHCCRRFIETYGALACVTDSGDLRSVMWNVEVPGFYGPAFAALASKVERGRISSIFLAKEITWGTPSTPPWSHLHVVPPPALIYRERLLTPGQAMAASKESIKTVSIALSEFKAKQLDEALRILKADAVARADRFVAPVQWLRDLHDRPKGKRGENLLWRAVALAPEGYLHPRAGMAGSLLEDIAAGLPFVDIQRKFNAKMHPLQYQRPQAAPTAGNIKAAEATFAKMGLEPALHRRFARIEEVPLLWSPPAPIFPKPAGGVFGHLKPKDGDEIKPVDIPAQTVTWEKFARTVLPEANGLEIRVPVTSGAFLALTAPVHADAPPILKWDAEEERNPIAWYVYPNGSPASQWGLTGGTYAKVTGISAFPPCMGSKKMPFLADGVILIIEGASDSRSPSNALFPECLKEDLHAVRATIEAYSRSATLSGREEASACGYDLRKGGACSARIRVRSSSGAYAEYHIDRWD